MFNNCQKCQNCSLFYFEFTLPTTLIHHRRIYFVKIINDIYPLSVFVKHPILDV